MSKRIERVNELIKREISQIFLRHIEFPKDTLVTTTRVDSTPNLIETRIYISSLPEEKIGQVLRILNGQIFSIQQKINRKLNMRPIPKIIFKEEKDTSKADKIEKMLEKIKNSEIEKKL